MQKTCFTVACMLADALEHKQPSEQNILSRKILFIYHEADKWSVLFLISDYELFKISIIIEYMYLLKRVRFLTK